MSLVDKLDGVHIGDLLRLEGKSNMVGYIANYSAGSVTLSNMNTRDKRTGRTTSRHWWRTDESIITVPLKKFDAYTILEKYVAPDNQIKE